MEGAMPAVPRIATRADLLEPGDRFELQPDAPTGSAIDLHLPYGVAALLLERLEDEGGQPLDFDALGSRITLSANVLPSDMNAVWLEYLAPGRFRLVAEQPTPEAGDPQLVTEQGVPLGFDPGDGKLLRHGRSEPANQQEFELSLRAARLATHAGFDRLICLPLVRDMALMEHQLRTARTVLDRFRGRALLCDEVGLGKTIEAGLVLSELAVRGLAGSVLVLVPPSLIEQWQGEMRRKFSIELESHDSPAFRERGPAAWAEFDRIIASFHTAKREPHRSAILGRRWDLVIVDEAHHLRNRNTQLWRFASELRKQFILLLTATPVQNHLEELFNLVTLLEPGLLRTARQFQRQFVDRRDKLTPRNVDELHGLLGEVMVRNRRSTVGLRFTRRWARTECVIPTPGERSLYEGVTRFVRGRLRTPGGGGPLTRRALITLQMALGSSRAAATRTLHHLSENAGLTDADRDELAALGAAARAGTDSSKLDRLLDLIAEFPDKIVIFTQFRATQELLAERLGAAGHNLALFHGGLTRLEKEAAITRFRGPARLLVCTESGSEGRNLQFAHAVVNFDLPWNPMKIEQRIGRLSRIGQEHDVHVFNLVSAGTLEAAVLHLLEAKLSMFELVIGEIDMILGNLDEEREFEEVVAETWADAADDEVFQRRMEELGNRLVAAKQAYLGQKAHDERLFADRFAPDG